MNLDLREMMVCLATMLAIMIAAAIGLGAVAVYSYSVPSTDIGLAEPPSAASIHPVAYDRLDNVRTILAVGDEARSPLESCLWNSDHGAEDLAGLAIEDPSIARSSISAASEKGIECPIGRFQQS